MNNRMSSILCPVDFSETSRRSLHCAVDLATRHDGRLTVVHVIPHTLPPLSGLAVQTSGSLEGSTRERLRQDMLEELQLFSKPVANGAPVRYLVEEGSIVDTIVTLAGKADLLVLGTHGHSGVERLILGSVTEKALHKAPCPVLTVPPAPASAAAPCGPFKRILCALDFSPASERALVYAVGLAKEGDGRVTLIHVIEGLLGEKPQDLHLDVRGYLHKVEEQVRERLRSLSAAESRWQQPEALVATGKAHVEILSAIEERHFDLVAMGGHGRSGLGELLFGSTARHVVRGAPCPVLTVAPTGA